MRQTPDLRVYLVTGENVSDARAGEIVTAAVAGGVTIVQLRAKEADSATRAALARQLVSRLAPYGVPLIVNDDLDAARRSGAAGVHVGPDDVHPAEARQALGEDAIVGWSIHRLDQLSDTEALAACDYLAASPVWSTATKTNTAPPLGLEGVRALRDAMPAHLLLVGIGGISEENAGEVIRAGADGVSVVSAIWSAPDARAAARGLRAVVDAALAHR